MVIIIIRLTLPPLRYSQLSIVTLISIIALANSVCDSNPSKNVVPIFYNLLICSFISWLKKSATIWKYLFAMCLRIIKISGHVVNEIAFSKHPKISRFFQWAFIYVFFAVFTFIAGSFAIACFRAIFDVTFSFVFAGIFFTFI